MISHLPPPLNGAILIPIRVPQCEVLLARSSLSFFSSSLYSKFYCYSRHENFVTEIPFNIFWTSEDRELKESGARVLVRCSSTLQRAGCADRLSFQQLNPTCIVLSLDSTDSITKSDLLANTSIAPLTWRLNMARSPTRAIMNQKGSAIDSRVNSGALLNQTKTQSQRMQSLRSQSLAKVLRYLYRWTQLCRLILILF